MGFSCVEEPLGGIIAACCYCCYFVRMAYSRLLVEVEEEPLVKRPSRPHLGGVGSGSCLLLVQGGVVMEEDSRWKENRSLCQDLRGLSVRAED